MDERVSLRSHLEQSASQAPSGVSDTIAAIAAASIDLSALIADGPLAGIVGANGGVNPDGDQQKAMDVVADEMMRKALRNAPVAAVLSEEAALPETLNPDAPLCVAIDPLDGSANLENNISVGTIFRSGPGAMTFCRLSSNPVPRSAPLVSLFTVRRPRSCSR